MQTTPKRPYVERALDARELSFEKPTGLPHIVRNELVKGGAPIIQGTRTPVSAIVERYRAGLRPEKIREHYEHLSVPQIYAALLYYAEHPNDIVLSVVKAQPVALPLPPRDRLLEWGVADVQPVKECCALCRERFDRPIYLFTRYGSVGFYHVNRGTVEGQPRRVWFSGRGLRITCERGHVTHLLPDGATLCE
jgi:uncharacterized protein (DUF433 family)